MVYKLTKCSNKLFFAFIFILFSLSNHNTFANQEPLIRVLIARDRFLRVRADSSIPLIINNKLFPNKRVKGITIKQKNNQTTIFFDKNKDKGYEINNLNKLTIKSFDRRGIWIGGKRYPGTIKIVALKDQLFVVNILKIEKYLSSVVGSEMPHKWHIEALKAQAIASRTYALKRKGNTLFDLDSTQKTQVYNGLESRTSRTKQAVKNTRSLVLTHQGKLINAVFHSSSGGITENSSDVWKNDFPYLVSVKDFDQINPKRNWQKGFSKIQLESIFPETGGIENIEILEKSRTGRIKELKISGRYGTKLFSGEKFRIRLNLKSTLFRFQFNENDTIIKINNNNDDLNYTKKPFLIFYGLGSGHGVGMSQWGARAMARKGYKADEILEHYYEGVKIKPYKTIYK